MYAWLDIPCLHVDQFVCCSDSVCWDQPTHKNGTKAFSFFREINQTIEVKVNWRLIFFKQSTSHCTEQLELGSGDKFIKHCSNVGSQEIIWNSLFLYSFILDKKTLKLHFHSAGTGRFWVEIKGMCSENNPSAFALENAH